jgi:hypothetical protein
MRFILTVSLIVLSLSSTANAGDIYHCGDPVDYNLPVETEGVCDIYSRQLAYRLEANKLREQIYARQENFQAPAVEARKRYKEAIKKLNEERGTPKNKDAE